ncbi:MAG: flagellar biosynthetic protein FliR [Myxococcales bacterium]|nr:flagellar biosynthetic protein FliR [Myxococcales bacterium]
MSLPLLPLSAGLFLMVRLTGLMAAAPFFGLEGFPWALRLLLALGTAVVLAPVAPPTAPPADLVDLALRGAAEALLGLGLGLCAGMFLAGAKLAGQWMGLQMGLGFAGLVDPGSNDPQGALAHLLSWIALAVFVAADGHHGLLWAVARGCQSVPPGEAARSLGALALGVPQAGAALFFAAVSFAAPVVAVVFSVQVGLALLARAAPQFNLLSIGFIVTILAGLWVLSLSLEGVGESVRWESQRSLDLALQTGGVQAGP